MALIEHDVSQTAARRGTGSTEILLGYNADTGLRAAIGDVLVKIFDPSAYQCRLCGLTYGWMFMNRRWRRFLDGLDLEVVELHRNELRRLYDRGDDLPAIFLRSNGELTTLISAAEMDAIVSLDELIEKTQSRLTVR